MEGDPGAAAQQTLAELVGGDPGAAAQQILAELVEGVGEWHRQAVLTVVRGACLATPSAA